MDIRIDNRIKPRGGVSLPPSKSEAIRAALLYALAGEDPEKAVACFPAPYCGDIMAALAACRDLSRAYVGESAALLRFLIPVQAALYGKVSIRAGEALYKRGLSEAEECLGVSLAPDANGRIEADVPLTAARYEIDCSRSSQFLSGLLMALPLLPRDSRIVLTAPVQSVGYINMTIRTMAKFGVEIVSLGSGKMREAGASEGFVIQYVNDQPVDNAKQVVEIANKSKRAVFIEGVSASGRASYFGFGKDE